MADNILPIRMVLDKSGARSAADDFRADMAKLNAQLVADATAAARKEVEAYRKATGEKTKAERDALQARQDATIAAERTARRAHEGEMVNVRALKRASQEVATAHADGGSAAAKAGQSGAAAFASMGLSIAVAQKGLELLTRTAGAASRAMEEADARARAKANNVIGQRDQLGELATLMGRVGDKTLVTDVARFNTATRMKPEEGPAFLTELYNSGAQFKGTSISAREFDQYAEQAGSLATALGFERGQAGNLAGTVLGFQDFSKFGGQASEQATAKLNSSLQILGHGKGRQATMMSQMSMLSSAALKEPGMAGAFTDADEAAIALSIAAEKHDAQASELTQMAKRWFMGFDKKQGEILSRAGVDPNKPNFLANVEKIAPVLKQMEKEQGKPYEQILYDNSEDQGTAEALSVFLNKGVFGGGFNERRAFGKTVQGQGPLAATMKKFTQSDQGVTRLRDAQGELGKVTEGSKGARLETLRREAIAQLGERGELDSAWELTKDYIGDSLTLGFLGRGEQARVDRQVKANLLKRLPAAARAKFTAPGLFTNPEGTPVTAGYRAEQLNEMISTIEQGGVNPLTGAPVTENPARNGMDLTQRKGGTNSDVTAAINTQTSALLAALGGGFPPVLNLVPGDTRR